MIFQDFSYKILDLILFHQNIFQVMKRNKDKNELYKNKINKKIKNF